MRKPNGKSPEVGFDAPVIDDEVTEGAECFANDMKQVIKDTFFTEGPDGELILKDELSAEDLMTMFLKLGLPFAGDDPEVYDKLTEIATKLVEIANNNAIDKLVEQERKAEEARRKGAFMKVIAVIGTSPRWAAYATSSSWLRGWCVWPP